MKGLDKTRANRHRAERSFFLATAAGEFQGIFYLPIFSQIRNEMNTFHQIDLLVQFFLKIRIFGTILKDPFLRSRKEHSV